MKKVLRLIVFALAMQLTLSAQIVPNGSFEEWENNEFGIPEPVNWDAPFNLTGLVTVSRVDGYNGGFAAKLNAAEFSGFGIVGPVLETIDFPVSERYTTITGYLKGELAATDTLYVLAGFYIDNDDELVGLGFNFYHQDFADFTSFSINVFYPENVVPNNGWITFFIGNEDGEASLGSSITIDDIELSSGAGMGEISPVFGRIGNAYPNPASSQINIPFELREPDNISITITDLTGRVVYRKMNSYYAQGANELNVDLSGISPGTYFYSIIPADGRSVIKKFVVK
jgi:hypothetical protein